MPNLTATRIQHNNRVFREANDRIRGAAEQYEHGLERIPFLCECPVESCVDALRLTPEEYASVRANDRHFMTAVGHEEAERPVGEVVERRDGYVLVEKR